MLALRKPDMRYGGYTTCATATHAAQHVGHAQQTPLLLFGTSAEASESTSATPAARALQNESQCVHVAGASNPASAPRQEAARSG